MAEPVDADHAWQDHALAAVEAPARKIEAMNDRDILRAELDPARRQLSSSSLRMRMFMLFDRMFGRGVLVQFLDRVFVVVLSRFPDCMDVGMRVLMRMGVRVLMRMHHIAVGMPVGVDVRVQVNMRMIVFGLACHGTLLLTGTESAWFLPKLRGFLADNQFYAAQCVSGSRRATVVTIL